MNALTRVLGIELPVIQGPMGGGPSTPELVAAVSNAGGLGSLGAAYLAPEQILDAVRRIRALTDRPFNVNLFAGGYEPAPPVDPAPMLALLSEIHAALQLPPPAAPLVVRDPFPDQFAAVLEAQPPIFSFTFGIPPAEAIQRLAARRIPTLGTATTVREARIIEASGVTAIVLQGEEAGAHRGTFAGPFGESMVPTLELVAEAAPAVSVPVVASGGLMDGRDLAAALARGASAVQLGTAFLACPESGAPETHKRAILEAKSDTTVITRAFSGRPARGLRNAFITALEGKDGLILPFPLQNALTRPMRTAAAARGVAGYLSLWAGRGVARARGIPAGDLVARLAGEAGLG